MAEVKMTPNSHKYKAEQEQRNYSQQKKVKRVVKNGVKPRKKDISSLFIAEDLKSVGKYVLEEVLIPTVKNAIVDMVSNGVAMMFGCEKRKSSKGNSSTPYVSYRDYSSRSSGSDFTERRRYDFEYDVIESRSEAEEILEQMSDLIDTYDSVSVADVYEMLGKKTNYTDFDYGWTNIASAKIIRVSNGYVLKLPRVKPLKN